MIEREGFRVEDRESQKAGKKDSRKAHGELVAVCNAVAKGRQMANVNGWLTPTMLIFSLFW